MIKKINFFFLIENLNNLNTLLRRDLKKEKEIKLWKIKKKTIIILNF